MDKCVGIEEAINIVKTEKFIAILRTKKAYLVRKSHKYGKIIRIYS